MHSLAVEKRKQMATERVARYRELSQVAQLEKRAMQSIINHALSHTPEENFWQAYEDLKAQASSLVGWDAGRDELRTRTHYLIMIEFVLWLLELAEKPVVEGELVAVLKTGSEEVEDDGEF